MAKRHIRAIAVCGIAVLALTGARGSRGGSCDSDSGSSSSSSGGHSSNNGSSDSDSSTTSGGSTGEAGNVSPPAAAAGDIKIDDCVFKESKLRLIAKLRITNTQNTSKTYRYFIKIDFKDTSGATITTTGLVANVKAGASTTAEGRASHYDPEHKKVLARCEITEATKS